MALKLWALKNISYISYVITIKQTTTMAILKTSYSLMSNQEFMRQCCRQYNSDTYEWEETTATETVRLLRQYLKQQKTYIKENKF